MMSKNTIIKKITDLLRNAGERELELIYSFVLSLTKE